MDKMTSMKKIYKWLTIKYPYIRSFEWRKNTTYKCYEMFFVSFSYETYQVMYYDRNGQSYGMVLFFKKKDITIENFLNKYKGFELILRNYHHRVIVPKDELELEIELMSMGENKI